MSAGNNMQGEGVTQQRDPMFIKMRHPTQLQFEEPDIGPAWPIGWTLTAAFAVSGTLWYGIFLACEALIQALA